MPNRISPTGQDDDVALSLSLSPIDRLIVAEQSFLSMQMTAGPFLRDDGTVSSSIALYNTRRMLAVVVAERERDTIQSL